MAEVRQTMRRMCERVFKRQQANNEAVNKILQVSNDCFFREGNVIILLSAYVVIDALLLEE